MTQYQLSDEIYGLFGRIYDTEAEAEDALEGVIAEHLIDTAEFMEIREEQEAEASYRQPREISHAEVVAEIRQCLFINQIEVADPEPEQADIVRLFLAPNLTAIARIERERLAWNAEAIRLTTHPY